MSLRTLLALFAVTSFPNEAKPLGYQDTPIIPGTKWHVHDGHRPQPAVVTPGRTGIQERAGSAPGDAVVLFDGGNLTRWKMEKGGREAAWKIEDGYVEVVPKTGDMVTREEFGPDLQFHLEFATPPPEGSGQGRGNSGVFFFGRYEIQILDSYQNPTYPDGQATAIYGYRPPLVNASLPPGQWQTYDIVFEGPRFKDGKLDKPAVVTVFHNGVLTQNRTVLIGDTPHKKVGSYRAHPEKGPIKIQDHGNRMRFRNIWIREVTLPTPLGCGDVSPPWRTDALARLGTCAVESSEGDEPRLVVESGVMPPYSKADVSS